MEDVILEIRNLKYDIPGKTLIDGFSLVVRKGENLVVSGPSGAGKSTLLKLIAGMLTPSAGKIFY